jgi:hypothetical protein
MLAADEVQIEVGTEVQIEVGTEVEISMCCVLG